MDMLSVLVIATQCATAAPPPVVAALVMTETNGAVYSLQIDGKRTTLPNFDEAVQNAVLGILDESNVKVGIAAVPTQEFDKRGISYSEGFSACRNMEVAAEVLRESWKQFGGQGEHWKLAVLEMATGNPSIEGDFAHQFDQALAQAQKIIQNNPRLSTNSTVKRDDSPLEAVSPSVNNLPSSDTAHMTKSWNVYDRSSSSPLLVFSK